MSIKDIPPRKDWFTLLESREPAKASKAELAQDRIDEIFSGESTIDLRVPVTIPLPRCELNKIISQFEKDGLTFGVSDVRQRKNRFEIWREALGDETLREDENIRGGVIWHKKDCPDFLEFVELWIVGQKIDIEEYLDTIQDYKKLEQYRKRKLWRENKNNTGENS